MAEPAGQLKRQIGLFHAVLLGLGSILGTGVFVSIGIAAGIAGPAVLVAIVLAALLALCNGLSSAQLAAAHPVAGGTYEYGYKYLNDKLGFTAGWMFFCAKSASAATAALGVVSFLVAWMPGYGKWEVAILVLFAVAVVVAVTGVVLAGIRRTSWINACFVSVTVVALLLFILSASYSVLSGHYIKEVDLIGHASMQEYYVDILLATPLLFVAFTGYGRIATLGEEVHDPRRIIPRAVIVTLLVTTFLYLGVGLFVGQVGSVTWVTPMNTTAIRATKIEVAAGFFDVPRWIQVFLIVAAITAMLGVLLNLILGLSRVVLAMGRRGDMPRVFAKVNASGTTPVPAVLLVAGIIAGLTLIGDVKATWSFAAFTVLIYYGITNLACLRLPSEDRLYPRAFAWVGLAGCLFLAWWVEPIYWGAGLILIGLGLCWHLYAQRYLEKIPDPREVCAGCGYDLRASADACPECGTAIPSDVVTEN